MKICRGPDSEETFLLCRSASRIDKERAMHERFKARIDAGLDSLERRIDKSTKAARSRRDRAPDRPTPTA